VSPGALNIMESFFDGRKARNAPQANRHEKQIF
jgi:hypothetical protein